MTNEEKAKAYDEALKRAKNLENTTTEEDALIKYIFPELAENEDERIREFLIDLLSHGTWKKDWPFSPAECVAWLEKQKDINCLACDEHLKGYLAGRKVTEEKQKEQKPVEIHIDNPNIEKFDPNVKITTSDSSADRKVYCEEVRDAFESNSDINIPEKQAEWSEEDEKTINNACCWIAEYAGYLMDKNYSKASMLMSLTDKLKSLRPQLKKEWSEEDETCLEDALWCVMKTRHFVAKDACDLDACRCAEKWLKSLPLRCPKSTDNWEPSEEQMGALDNARFCKAYDRTELDSLYEQLNKLFRL